MKLCIREVRKKAVLKVSAIKIQLERLPVVGSRHHYSEQVCGRDGKDRAEERSSACVWIEEN